MVTRRLVVGGGLAFAALPAAAQLRAGTFRIGLLAAGGQVLLPENNPWMQAFAERLDRLGYTIGKNLSFETRAAGGNDKRLLELASELIATRPDAILVTSTPALMALFKQNSPIPVVFVIGFDPVKLGVVKNIARPDGNFTGLFNNATDVISKNFQILRDLLPNARRIAYLTDPLLDASRAVYQEQLNAASEHLGFEVKGFEAKTGDQLPAVFDQIVAFKADALTQGGGPFWTVHRRTIIELIHAHRLPSLHIFRMDAVDGALMSFGSDTEELFRTAASYTDKILRGAKPSDLPIEQATKMILVINMKTARQLEIEIPPVLIASASELIE
jgi:putative ABC transport system substrate-binding protein